MRKSRKPNVCEKKGILYYRIRWTEGGKRRERYIRLPPDENSEEHDRAYWSIRSGTSVNVQPRAKHTWDALIKDYVAKSNYKRLSAGTRRKYKSVIDEIRAKNGGKDVRKTTRAQIRAIHAKYSHTPRAADHRLQVIRILLKWAKIELEWIDKNPAEGISLYGTQTEYQPWPENAQAEFVETARRLGETDALTAYMLGTGTGQRPGDLCGMQWAHYDGEYMAVVQDKTKERIWVYCPESLRAYLNALPRRGKFVLAKNLTQPITYDAIAKRFARVRSKTTLCAGLVMHGWRYTAAVALAEAGCSDAEIQAVTGHKTMEMVRKYRSRAQQKHLSKQAQERRK